MAGLNICDKGGCGDSKTGSKVCDPKEVTKNMSLRMSGPMTYGIKVYKSVKRMSP